MSGGRSYVVVGTEGGVYVCARGDISKLRVYTSTIGILTPLHNKISAEFFPLGMRSILLHYKNIIRLLSLQVGYYSRIRWILWLVLVKGHPLPRLLTHQKRRFLGTILSALPRRVYYGVEQLVRASIISKKIEKGIKSFLVVYTVKTFRQTNVITMEVSNEPSVSRLRQKKTLSYKPFGSVSSRNILFSYSKKSKDIILAILCSTNSL